MKQTAVEFLIRELINNNHLKSISSMKQIIEEAKEMEKQQIIDACVNTTQDCFKSAMHYMSQEIVFTEQDLINQRNEAEQYYNETFNK